MASSLSQIKFECDDCICEGNKVRGCFNYLKLNCVDYFVK